MLQYSENFRWMGPVRYDFAGARKYLGKTHYTAKYGRRPLQGFLTREGVTQGWRALTVCRVMYKPSDEGRENILCEVGCTQCPPDPPATTRLDIAAEERLVNMATGKGLETGHVIYKELGTCC
jgi:hypothetical protein